MVETVLLSPLLAAVFCQGFVRVRRWLLAGLVSFFALPPLVLSVLLLGEGSLPPVAWVVPWIAPATPLVVFAGSPLTLTLMGVTTLCFWCVFLALLVDERTHPSELSALAFLQFSLSGLLLAHSPFTLTFFWILSALPQYFLTVRTGKSSAPNAPVKSLATNSLSVACVAVGMAVVFPDFASPFGTGSAMESTQILALAAIVTGALARLGVWPFHGWITWTAFHCRPVPAAPLSVLYSMTGLVPLLVLPADLPWNTFMVGIGTLSLVYLALCALGEREVYRFLSHARGAAWSLVLLLLAADAAHSHLGWLLASQGLALFFCFLFISDFTSSGRTSWIVKPDGSPGFTGLWATHRREALVAGSVILGGLVFPSLISLHPSFRVWTVLHELSLPMVGTVCFGLLVTSRSWFEKYRAVFLTPGTGTRTTATAIAWVPLFPLLVALGVLAGATLTSLLNGVTH